MLSPLPPFSMGASNAKGGVTTFEHNTVALNLLFCALLPPSKMADALVKELIATKPVLGKSVCVCVGGKGRAADRQPPPAARRPVFRPFLTPPDTDARLHARPHAAAACHVFHRPLPAQTAFSKTYCPYCTKAKNALRDVLGPRADASLTVIELDQRADGAAIQSALAFTGATSVPRVFIGGKFIGGGDDTVALAKSGELLKLVNAAALA